MPFRSNRGMRHAVNRFKQHRAIATRNGKLEVTYHALLVIAGILPWW